MGKIIGIDLRHGKGEYYFNNGAVLKGTWVKGQKEGQFNLKVLEENTYMNMKKGNYVIKYSKDIWIKREINLNLRR